MSLRVLKGRFETKGTRFKTRTGCIQDFRSFLVRRSERTRAGSDFHFRSKDIRASEFTKVGVESPWS